MSKTWYPVINIELCTECGTCVNKCTHGVYNKDEAPRAVVIYPEGCVQGCTGCGTLCPSGAITYFSGTSQKSPGGCCEGGCCEGGCHCGEEV